MKRVPNTPRRRLLASALLLALAQPAIAQVDTSDPERAAGETDAQAQDPATLDAASSRHRAILDRREPQAVRKASSTASREDIGKSPQPTLRSPCRHQRVSIDRTICEGSQVTGRGVARLNLVLLASADAGSSSRGPMPQPRAFDFATWRPNRFQVECTDLRAATPTAHRR